MLILIQIQMLTLNANYAHNQRYYSDNFGLSLLLLYVGVAAAAAAAAAAAIIMKLWYPCYIHAHKQAYIRT